MFAETQKARMLLEILRGTEQPAGDRYNLMQFFAASAEAIFPDLETCLLALMLQRRTGVEEQRAASMFIFRLAFWIGLAILLLPSDERQQERLYATAVATVERATTFCDRNPKVCAAGGEMWSMFLKKAEFGVRMAINVAGSGGRSADDAASPQPPAAMKSAAE